MRRRLENIVTFLSAPVLVVGLFWLMNAAGWYASEDALAATGRFLERALLWGVVAVVGLISALFVLGWAAHAVRAFLGLTDPNQSPPPAPHLPAGTIQERPLTYRAIRDQALQEAADPCHDGPLRDGVDEVANQLGIAPSREIMPPDRYARALLRIHQNTGLFPPNLVERLNLALWEHEQRIDHTIAIQNAERWRELERRERRHQLCELAALGWGSFLVSIFLMGWIVSLFR